MPMPLANRFLHIEMRSDFNTWQTWAVLNGIHKDVVSYLSFAKNDLYDFDAKSSSHAFATPRSWVFVSDILKDYDDNSDTDTLFTLVAGCVGEGLAAKFSAHRKISGKLPNPSDILNGIVTTLDIKEVSAMYSLTISMCYEMKDMIDNKRVSIKDFNPIFDNFLSYMMTNFETELVILGAKIALKTYNLDMDPTKLKHFEEFHKKFGKYVLDAVK
jgi:hypothetical protein